MPTVCINRPNRSRRRVWTPRATGRVSLYSSVEDGHPAETMAWVAHCLGYSAMFLCLCDAIRDVPRGTSQGTQEGAVASFRKQADSALQATIERLRRLRKRLPGRFKRLITVAIAALELLRRLLERIPTPEEQPPLAGCAEFAGELLLVCEQLRIILAAGPEVSRCPAPPPRNAEPSGS